jgi:hypothetical protein
MRPMRRGAMRGASPRQSTTAGVRGRAAVGGDEVLCAEGGALGKLPVKVAVLGKVARVVKGVAAHPGERLNPFGAPTRALEA